MAQDIVFDIGGMHFRSGLVDENGRVSAQVAFESPGDPDELVEHIRRVVDSFSVSTVNPAVGIAIGGLVTKDGLVTAGAINMVDYPLIQRLALRHPAVVLNDARAAALAEAHFNPRLSGRSSFLLLTVSAGIGGGVVIGGELYEGHHNIAGEVGHLIIDRGQDCYCRLGHRGCLDALASGRALNHRMRKLWREGHWTHLEEVATLKDLPQLLADGDGMALRLVAEAGKWIGEGMMQTVRVFDPCEVVFKGYLITALWEYLHPHISAVIRAYGYDLPLSRSALGEHVGLIGAGLAAQRLRAQLAPAAGSAP
ncbi:MAG TPA: ROK family protein [Armatimonadota bacterium]|nr:ROK family protein [Armatimonadota bacterium]